MANSSVGSFEVITRMINSDGQAYLSPLDNIISMRKVKAGVQITIGVGDPVTIEKIASGGFVGGLLLADKEEFRRMKTEMEAADER